jgi:hypothetical protein
MKTSVFKTGAFPLSHSTSSSTQQGTGFEPVHTLLYVWSSKPPLSAAQPPSCKPTYSVLTLVIHIYYNTFYGQRNVTRPYKNIQFATIHISYRKIDRNINLYWELFFFTHAIIFFSLIITVML